MKFKKPDYFTMEETPTLDDFTEGGLEVKSSVTVPYCFTLRKVTNAGKSDQNDYLFKFEKFNRLGIDVSEWVFEKNHTNAGIHAHGVMQIPKSFQLKRLRTRGWHLHLDEMNNKAAWDAYCSKEQILNQEESEELEPCFKMPTKRLF